MHFALNRQKYRIIFFFTSGINVCRSIVRRESDSMTKSHTVNKMIENIIRYSAVFIITALWDLVWQMMSKGKIYICFDENIEILCPSEWEWIKSGEKYFENHTSIGAMVIAGLCGIYALAVMDLLKPIIGFGIVNVLFSSWVVGIPMRYFTDPLHVYLFSNLREHYYNKLGFLLTSYTDAQSGLIVYLTYGLFKVLIACAVGSSYG